MAWIATPSIAPDFRGPTSRPFNPMPGPEAAQPLVLALHAVVCGEPDRPAVEEGAGEVSYAQLWSWSAAIATALRSETQGGPVAILLPSSAAYIAAVFACLAAGRLSVLLDETYPVERNRDILAATGAGIILATSRSGADAAFPHVRVLAVDKICEEAPPSLAAPGASGLMLDEPAFILCTSGSTGAPKPVVHSQRTMFHWARTTHNAMHVTQDDRALSLSSLSTLGGFTALLSYPLAGACQQMLDLKTLGLSGLFRTLQEKPVTILRAAPSLLRGLCGLSDSAEAFSRLRVVQTYGEPLTRADAEALRAALDQRAFIRTTWGSTECSGLSWFVGPEDEQHPIYEPGGCLMPDTEAQIVDDDGAACEIGEVGELSIRSRYNALGEWGPSGLVAGRLEPDPDDPKARVYRTGDLARMDAEGVFVILGRKDRMAKINGQRMEPSEIEAVLRADPDVARAEVVVDTSASRQKILGFVVPKGARDPGLEAQLKARVRERLPVYMVPSRILILDEIPLLPGGKVDGRQLLEMAASGQRTKVSDHG